MSVRHVGRIGGLALVGALLAACGTPGITRLSADTYRVSRAGPVVTDDAALRAAAVADADAFARGKGLRAEPVSFQAETLAVGRLKTLDYEFRLVAPGAAAAPATAATPPPSPRPPESPAGRVAGPAPLAAPLAAPPAAPPPAPPSAAPRVPPPAASAGHGDYYDELIRLDDLRQRGILTDEEFQRLKAKIIAER